MKFQFQKIVRFNLDVDFQKIYNLIIQKTGKDDFYTIYHQFADNTESYLLQTHDFDSLLNSYDLMFLNSDFWDNEAVLESIVDNFHTFLRDKFNI